MITDKVSAWAEPVTIPTYPVGAPNRNPMFLDRRVYQGSSGVVYPLPVVDHVFDVPEDRTYTALYLENRWLKIMILPELGGRVQMALDKTNDYHFVYYNRVIKPALVGLEGPWLSGGIEFNWPQHHRPTTFAPMDWTIEQRSDGAQTIWCAEIDPMFFTKGMHGFTLHPDRAVLEVSVQLYNRTELPQTFLWWANPAVAVNDNYQTVFPPDVTAVMDHGKRDVATFPIATGTYYKHDYAPGTDIRWYKNIPVPTSYMAYKSDFNFVGGYDHGRDAGMLHVADHHVVPGKKMWTWGAGDFGAAWNRHLTDEDGPYIELMCGAYTDNQPDFSWIEPGEEKRFTQNFLPYKQIGPPQNASTEALLRLTTNGNLAEIGVYVTSPRTVRVLLLDGVKALYDATHELSPATALRADVPLLGANPDTLRLEAWDDDELLLSCAARLHTTHPIPAPATAAPSPDEIATNEELYLHALHLEQYRHATWDPEPYYREALQRDPMDSRANNALGLLLYKSGRFEEAEACFRNAVERLTMRNTNPRDGEPFYNHGLALRMLGRDSEALDAFRKAMWSAAWVSAAGFEAARIAARTGTEGDFDLLGTDARNKNMWHHRFAHLSAAFYRNRGRTTVTSREIDGALARDTIEYGALHETRLIHGTASLSGSEWQPGETVAVALAIDYTWAGFYGDAIELLRDVGGNRALPIYLTAWVLRRAGDVVGANAALRDAANASPDFAFPHRLEEYLALEEARRYNPADALAAYALGNFLYAHRRKEEALAQWQVAVALNPAFATAQRNLGLALANVRGDFAEALAAYERAFALDPADARVLFELDQLRRRMGKTPKDRLDDLQVYESVVLQRDDLTIEFVSLLNMNGKHARALDVLLGHTFHPWEGGEGKASAQYVYALTAQARAALGDGEAAAAISLLESARARPRSLGEGKLEGERENDVHYLLGCAHRAAGDLTRASEHFALACEGASTPALALVYYDQPPEMLFYQALALNALGERALSRGRFQALIDYGEKHEMDAVQMDYFAVSMPEFSLFAKPLNLRHRLHCIYMVALGALGSGDTGLANHSFERILSLDPDHQGAHRHRAWVPEDAHVLT